MGARFWIALLLAFALPATAPAADIPLRFENQELAAIVRHVARATGERFLFDDRLRGRVSLIVAQPVEAEEALELLRAALLMKGFVALPTPAGGHKIVPVDGLPAGAPWIPDAVGRGETPLVTQVTLAHSDPTQLVDTLSPLVGAQGLALAYPPTHSVILASTERRVHRWLRLLRALDQASEASLLVRKLRHRPVDEVVDIVDGLWPEAESRRFRLVPDARTNLLVAYGAPVPLEELRAWIERLDVPAEGRGELQAIRLRHADAEDLAQTLQAVASGGVTQAAPQEADPLAGRDFQVSVYPPTNTLVLRADPETHALLRDLVKALDRDKPRVAVEALVVEITTDASLALGFDAFVPLTDPKDSGELIATVLSNPSGGGLREPGADQGVAAVGRFTRAPLTLPIVDESGEATAALPPQDTYVVTADGRSVRSRVLMRPHILTLPGEEHEIFVGNNIPIPVGEADQNLSSLSVRSNIQREDTGVRLRVRPFLGEADRVRLEIDLEESGLAPSVTGSTARVGPTIRQRRLSATAHLNENEYAVVGSLAQPRFETIETGTPWLKDLPILGWLFRTEREQRLRTQIVIALHARLHRNPEEDLAESIRRRLAFERSLARVNELLDPESGRYALLVATEGSEDDAEARSRALADASGFAGRVVRWSREDGTPRYDVYVTGFEKFARAAEAALSLDERGWRSELVALPVDH